MSIWDGLHGSVDVDRDLVGKFADSFNRGMIELISRLSDETPIPALSFPTVSGGVSVRASGQTPFDTILLPVCWGAGLTARSYQAPPSGNAFLRFIPDPLSEYATAPSDVDTLQSAATPQSLALLLGGHDAFELEVVSWGDGTVVPTSGDNLVIVGIDNSNLLHIRIFDDSGSRVIDTDETELPAAQAAAIAALKQQVSGLLPPHIPTGDEKVRVISEATSIVGRTRQDPFIVETLLPLLEQVFGISRIQAHPFSLRQWVSLRLPVSTCFTQVMDAVAHSLRAHWTWARDGVYLGPPEDCGNSCRGSADQACSASSMFTG
jgi:hypothetical protein